MLSTVCKPDGGSLPRDLEKLFDEHGRFIFRVALQITGNKWEAEDILQNVFLRLLQSDRLSDLELNPKGYLYRAAVNMALDGIRRQRRNAVSDDLEHATSAPDQVREYRSREIQACFRTCLADLSPRAAEMFILKHVEGYDNREIAQMLGTTRGTVAVTLFHSRTFLKKSMRRFL